MKIEQRIRYTVEIRTKPIYTDREGHELLWNVSGTKLIRRKRGVKILFESIEEAHKACLKLRRLLNKDLATSSPYAAPFSDMEVNGDGSQQTKRRQDFDDLLPHKQPSIDDGVVRKEDG